MRKSIQTFLISLIVLLLSSNQILATGILGGELTYTSLGSNQYVLKVTLYRECSSEPADTVAIVKMYSVSCSISATTKTLRPIASSPIEIGPNCPGNISSCQGGTAPGIEKWEYHDTIALPGNCPDFIFTYTKCCRDTDITNLDSQGSQDFFIGATLNNQSVSSNSSPIFSDPFPYLQTGFQQIINFGVFDPEGDSLAYSLVSAMESPGWNINYNSPFTPLNPIRSNPAMTLDPTNGLFTVTPSNIEVDVLVLQVNEYRNGVLIGNVTRDIKISVVDRMNQAPTLSGINGTTNNTIHVCAGETLHFMIYSDDLDTVDSTTILPNVSSVLPVNLNVFNQKHDSASIELATDITMARTAPYTIRIDIADSRCPFTQYQSVQYVVYVDTCQFDVWPGDANVDLKCDLYDIFPIGLAYGSNGPVRVGANLNWVADSTGDWSQDFIFGVNYKHADCNGDGIVDNADTTAISLNYGLTHLDGISNPKIIHSNELIYLHASKDSAGPAETFSVDICLGNSTNPVDSIYGIAFILNFNPILVDSTQTSLSFLNSNLGTPGLDLLTFSKVNWIQGRIAGVAVRTDQNNSFSDSTIASFNVKIVDNLAVNVTSLFSLSGVRGTTADGVTHFLQDSSDSIYVNINTVGLNSLIQENEISLIPNPARNELIIICDPSVKGSVIIFDLSGREIIKIYSNSPKTKIDISKLPNGIYSVGIKTELGLVRKKLVVSR